MNFELTLSVIVRAAAALIALSVAAIAVPRRAQPGARSLAALMCAAAVWCIGTVLEYAAVGISNKVFWAKLEYPGIVTAPVFFLLFALEYARTHRWLARRNLALLFIVPALSVGLVFTNEWHQLIWNSFTLATDSNQVIYGHGPWFWIGVAGYAYAMLASATILLMRAALNYPNVYRSQIVAVVCGALLPWLGNVIYIFKLGPAPGVDLTPLLIVLSGATFAWAIFRHHWYDLIPVARHNIIERMDDAMFVVDLQDRVVDLNAAAQQFIGQSAARALGQPVARVLGRWQNLAAALRDPIQNQTELELEIAGAPRSFEIRVAALVDARANRIGSVVTLHDSTEIKRARQALHHAALLEERERLARELHDNLGQVLSYLALNAQAVRDQIEQGNYAAALGQLDALKLAAQSANQDVREYILDITTQAEDATSFTAVLKTYLARFETITGLRVHLSLPDDSIDAVLPAPAYLNLLRIIQEALANARKHARATHAQIVFTLTPENVQVVIADDGAGFDATTAPTGFGLGIMQDRARQANAHLEIRSEAGHGTQIILNFARVAPDAARAQLAGVTVLLADDHPLFIEGIRNLLTARGMRVVGVARDGNQAIQLASELKPDVLLLDVQMPHRNGAQTVEPIRRVSPQTQIVMLSMAADDDALFESLRQGARGYLLKTQPPEDFFNALVAIRRGETALAPGLAHRLATAPESREARARQTLQAAGLSAQQIEILARIALGQLYKEIAAEFNLSESAIKYHIERIQVMLDVPNRNEAVARAFNIGLVPDRRGRKT